MVARKGLLAPQNTFLDTIAARFDGTHSNFVLGNARVPNIFPIVYCSDGFCDLSGYPRAYIMQKGCACRFLHGPGTDQEKIIQIEKALEAKTELQVEIQFYRKNGSPFWCLIDLVPITNEKHEVVLYLVSHKDITSNRLSVPGGITNSVLDDAPPTNFNPNRRRSRAVLYGIQDHYKTNSRTTKLAKINKQGLLNTSLPSHKPLPEYKTAVAKKPKLVFSHYGYLKCLWDVIIIIATIYVAIIVPYNAAFYGAKNDDISLDEELTVYCAGDGGDANTFKPTRKRDKKETIISDVLVEVIFVIDILLNFRTTFVNHKGEVVTNSKDITINYMKTWFFLDLVAALPFDFLDLFELNLMESYESIHLLKLTRLLRLARLVSKVERYSQYSSLILFLLMWGFFLSAHWLACIWYVIAEKELESSIFSIYNRGWMSVLASQHRYNDTRCVPDSEAYITALYFTCTSLTTVGFGNVSANTKYEKIFAVIIMMVGALMHATIFGHVTNIVQRSYARRSEYNSKWSDLKQFTEVHNVPKQLKQRMQDYFQSVWSINHGIDVTEVLADYPEELRGDVCLHLHKEVLGLALFQTASQGCLKSISLTIKTSFCAPDEYFIHSGDVVQNIFYLSSGSMEVVQDGMVVALLGKGDLVGCDIPLTSSNTNTDAANTTRCTVTNTAQVVKSSADVRALTYCFLECIHVPQLLQVLKLHSEFREQFCNDIQHDLTYNLRQGFEQDEEEVLLRSRLPSISEMSDNVSDVFVKSSPPALNALQNTDVAQIASLKMEMSSIIRKLDRMTLENSGYKVRTGSTSSSINRSTTSTISTNKGVQTDFPFSLLESYVVKNRSRILKLLNIPDPIKKSTSEDSGDKSSSTSPLLGNGTPASSSCSASIYNERRMAVTDF